MKLLKKIFAVKFLKFTCIAREEFTRYQRRTHAPPKEELTMADTKKLYIKTYGCQMNVYDSERMAETLGAEGYVQTDTADDADMILLNTCHIREKAAEKIYSELGKFR